MEEKYKMSMTVFLWILPVIIFHFDKVLPKTNLLENTAVITNFLGSYSIEMQELSGTRKKPSKKKPLKLPCPLIRHSSATDDIGAESYGFRDSSLSNTGRARQKLFLMEVCIQNSEVYS